VHSAIAHFPGEKNGRAAGTKSNFVLNAVSQKCVKNSLYLSLNEIIVKYYEKSF
jgi:hypothetical protein